MPKYKVIVNSTCCETYEVDASSLDEATHMWSEGDIIEEETTWDDFNVHEIKEISP